MTNPSRIRLRRAKGWRKPAGAVVVARPTRWGNPFPSGGQRTRAEAVALYRRALEHGTDGVPSRQEVRARLAGHDLACWCPLDGPCHADVLLEVANQEE